jgi:DNA-binding LacI/PurR family transcriptional regulator
MVDAHHMLLRAGCHNLAVVSSTIQSPSLLTRETLFIQAAEDAKQACILLRAGPTSYQTGVDAARRLLASRNRPDGVFCVTDLIACGFMDVAKNEFGLRIPEDICIVGFDDIEQSGWLGYQLTTFAQPLGEMADAISTLLENATDKERKKQHLTFHAPPVWRHTVRPSAS